MHKSITFLAVAALLVVATPAAAIFVDSTGKPAEVPFDDGGLVFHFLPNLSGELAVVASTGPDKRVDDPTPQGLRIIDKTLLSYDFTPVRADGRFSGRVGFSGRYLRAGLERLGIRANGLRVLRYLRDSGRWQRVRALRRNPGFAPAAASTGNNPLVWALSDQRSGVLAVAAVIIAEPATLALLVIGGALVIGEHRRRRLA